MREILHMGGSAGWRMFRRERRAWFVAILLGLAVGASLSLLSVVQATVRHPVRGVTDLGRVITIGGISQGASIGDPLQWWKVRGLDQLARYRVGDARIGSEQSSWLRVAEVSQDFFRVFALSAEQGRDFNGDDHRLSRAVAVVSRRTLRQLTGVTELSSTPIAIEVNRMKYEVVGVAARDFDFPSGTRIWLLETPIRERYITLVPGASVAAPLPTRNQAGWIGRLGSDSSAVEVKEQLAAVLTKTNDSLGKKTGRRYGSVVSVRSLAEYLSMPIRSAARAISWGTIFVVIAVAANTFLFFLGRALRRRAELSVRRALGATARQIVVLAVGEATALALVSATVGTLVTIWVVEACRELLTTVGILLPSDFRLVVGVSVASGLVSLLIALAAAITPTLKFGLNTAGTALRDRSQPGTGVLGPMYRTSLIGASAALSVLVCSGAVLTTRVVLTMLSMDLGISTPGVYVARLRLHREIVLGDRMLSVQAEALRRTRQLPGVISLGFSTNLPVRTEDRSYLAMTAESRTAMVASNSISGDFLEALGVSQVKGNRTFDQARDGVIINEVAARYFWHSVDVIGRTIDVGGESRRVIGVVTPIRASDESKADALELYRPVAPLRGASGLFIPMTLVVRCASHCEADFRRVMSDMFGDNASSVVAVESLDSAYKRAAAPASTRALLWLLYALVGVGVVLAGIFNVVGYVVEARRHEAGVRAVLGATPYSLALTLSSESLAAAIAGILLGTLAARAGSRVFEDLLGTNGFPDALAVAAVAGFLLAAFSCSALLGVAGAVRRPPSVLLR